MKVNRPITIAAYEQKLREQHVAKMMRAGSSMAGIYPAGEATKAEFEEWRKGKKLK